MAAMDPSSICQSHMRTKSTRVTSFLTLSFQEMSRNDASVNRTMPLSSPKAWNQSDIK